MSPSSTRDWLCGLSTRDRPARRGAVEPTVAIVAVFAVCAGMALYAGVLDDAVAVAGSDRDRAGPAADRLIDAISTGGVADPERLDGAVAALPGERRCNATVATASDREWAGPPAPRRRGSDAAAGSGDARRRADGGVDVAIRTVSVRLGPGRIAPGRLRVVVWS